MYTPQQAAQWDNDPQKVKRANAVAREIGRFFFTKKNNNALEFGCGTGLLSFELKDVFEHITLVDTSPSMIQVLKQKIQQHNIEHFTPLVADLITQKIKLNNIDVIYSLMVMHHIQNTEAALKAFNHILPIEKYLCIADLMKEDGSFHALQHGFDGHNGFDKHELNRLLLQNGFEVVFYKQVFAMQRILENQTKTYPLFLLIAQKKQTLS